MLTRPGSVPGSGWMRSVSERLSSGPADTSSLPRRFWVVYLTFMFVGLVILPWAQRRVMPTYTYNGRTYESAARIGGLPVFAVGPAPVGIVAVGGYAYAGNGVAFGYHEASGRQKEKLFG